jgi:hypothetical protein
VRGEKEEKGQVSARALGKERTSKRDKTDKQFKSSRSKAKRTQRSL